MCKGAIVFAVVFILAISVFRIYIANRIPLLLQADAKYDDYLLIQYADSIFHGDWLGPYSHTTFLKVVSASVLIALGRLIGLEYGTSQAIIYIFAVALLIYSFNKLICNKIWAVCTYAFLLFSPIMFHAENVQKIYRGGYIVSFSIIVIAGVVGIFTSSKEKISDLIKWSILEAISLPVFWFLKEDSVWLIPFVCVGIAISIICIILSDTNLKYVRILMCVIPLIVLIGSRFAYKEKNYKEYGLKAETDRSNTAFADMISDLLHIADAGDVTSWVTRETIVKACKASNTLGSIEDSIMSVYDGRADSSGNVNGDFVIMAIREAAVKEGLYSKTAKDTEDFYRNVHNELTDAFTESRLEKEKKRIYISHVSRGYSFEEIKSYYSERFVDNVLMLISYDHNETDIKQSTGPEDDLRLMSEYVGDKYVSALTTNEQIEEYASTVGLVNRIVNIYKATGKKLCKISMIGYVLCIATGIIGMFNKQNGDKNGKRFKDLWLIIISFGLLLTCILIIAAVIWFCNFLTDWKVYDYCSAIIPVIGLLESIGIYLMIKNIYMIGRKVYDHIC
ncbi:MAG: hypothetical protein K5868_02495 [Lachnospiraceae bacterium]|nr:hypothetical protein [Lachnospiraceae bacterium]